MTTQPVAERYAHEIVAANVRAELARAGMSGRRAAESLGLGVLYVSRRLNGSIEMDINDIVAFAKLLNVDVAIFFANTKNAPTPKGEGVNAKLPELDSNQQPAGFKPITYLPTIPANNSDDNTDTLHPVTALHA